MTDAVVERVKKRATVSFQQGVKNQKDLCSNFLFLLNDITGQQVWFDCESSKGAALADVFRRKGASEGCVPFGLGTGACFASLDEGTLHQVTGD